jgi:N-acetylglucosaminyldiphosphoundecaprenol N-acetyl-beta-D-mannosaminyltransferase
VIDDLDESGTVAKLESALAEGRGGWIVTANSDIARICHQRPEIRQILREADMVVADGMPLVWASKIIGAPLRARVCGSDLVWSIAQRAADSGRSLFLLGGGRPGTATEAGMLLKNRFPGLRGGRDLFPSLWFRA